MARLKEALRRSAPDKSHLPNQPHQKRPTKISSRQVNSTKVAPKWEVKDQSFGPTSEFSSLKSIASPDDLYRVCKYHKSVLIGPCGKLNKAGRPLDEESSNILLIIVRRSTSLIPHLSNDQNPQSISSLLEEGYYPLFQLSEDSELQPELHHQFCRYYNCQGVF
ncbi:MAG: hypothetical protein Ct9H90mP23_3280 [Methanobacteriota archaeon]|nr:MAG: hypothetical protein Ct9H90mP23_3280 [Euryarchaeota archaeon]